MRKLDNKGKNLLNFKYKMYYPLIEILILRYFLLVQANL